ncbi:hypothetical protein ACM66B_001676 [Microbotryomycetes sp. NB124-2]
MEAFGFELVKDNKRPKSLGLVDLNMSYDSFPALTSKFEREPPSVVKKTKTAQEKVAPEVEASSSSSKSKKQQIKSQKKSPPKKVHFDQHKDATKQSSSSLKHDIKSSAVLKSKPMNESVPSKGTQVIVLSDSSDDERAFAPSVRKRKTPVARQVSPVAKNARAPSSARVAPVKPLPSVHSLNGGISLKRKTADAITLKPEASGVPTPSLLAAEARFAAGFERSTASEAALAPRLKGKRPSKAPVDSSGVEDTEHESEDEKTVRALAAALEAKADEGEDEDEDEEEEEPLEGHEAGEQVHYLDMIQSKKAMSGAQSCDFFEAAVLAKGVGRTSFVKWRKMLDTPRTNAPTQKQADERANATLQRAHNICHSVGADSADEDYTLPSGPIDSRFAFTGCYPADAGQRRVYDETARTINYTMSRFAAKSFESAKWHASNLHWRKGSAAASETPKVSGGKWRFPSDPPAAAAELKELFGGAQTDMALELLLEPSVRVAIGRPPELHLRDALKARVQRHNVEQGARLSLLDVNFDVRVPEVDGHFESSTVRASTIVLVDGYRTSNECMLGVVLFCEHLSRPKYVKGAQRTQELWQSATRSMMLHASWPDRRGRPPISFTRLLTYLRGVEIRRDQQMRRSELPNCLLDWFEQELFNIVRKQTPLEEAASLAAKARYARRSAENIAAASKKISEAYWAKSEEERDDIYRRAVATRRANGGGYAGPSAATTQKQKATLTSKAALTNGSRAATATDKYVLARIRRDGSGWASHDVVEGYSPPAGQSHVAGFDAQRKKLYFCAGKWTEILNSRTKSDKAGQARKATTGTTKVPWHLYVCGKLDVAYLRGAKGPTLGHVTLSAGTNLTCLLCDDVLAQGYEAARKAHDKAPCSITSCRIEQLKTPRIPADPSPSVLNQADTFARELGRHAICGPSGAFRVTATIQKKTGREYPTRNWLQGARTTMPNLPGVFVEVNEDEVDEGTDEDTRGDMGDDGG